MSEDITSDRHRFAIGTIGGPTAVIDYGGLRFVTDPTFDPPGDYGAYRKTEGPAVSPAALGRVDAVLLSHDLHWDNFDREGRVFARRAPLIVTGRQSAERLGAPAIGLGDFEVHGIAEVRVHVVPAQHGPLDGERDDAGNINTEVHGFVLESAGLPTVYVSGDNAGIGPVKAIGAAFPRIDVAVLHAGAARVPGKNAGRALTLTSARAADVAALLDVGQVVAVHHEGWSVYSENFADLEREFAEAGIRSRLVPTKPGRWALRHEGVSS
ncbi:MBL fold metallo-hydrolase [Amycolatopsis sp. Poz14]|uniref:MBL fold metallo-hydrolase n=1 Tax=Amycolatopsis sp. Poz14 TaxID=1447705 RepID=UPI001EE8BB50|nr:MBL fold metallo-hydrolase [Amycolatopsis sp. Poz14]MCG3753609.1 MBL fold metallo-hydrolase [Amycolatopsis sp. Poz14]